MRLDAVLHSIVRRARMLLGTHLQVTDYVPDEQAGTPTVGHRRLGVADLPGAAAATGRRAGRAGGRDRPPPTPPPTTAATKQFRRRGSIDAGVLEEGLVAILGVPLLLGSGGGGETRR